MEMRGGGQNFLMINESLGKNKSTGKKEKKPIGKGKSKKKR